MGRIFFLSTRVGFFPMEVAPSPIINSISPFSERFFSIFSFDGSEHPILKFFFLNASMAPFSRRVLSSPLQL